MSHVHEVALFSLLQGVEKKILGSCTCTLQQVCKMRHVESCGDSDGLISDCSSALWKQPLHHQPCQKHSGAGSTNEEVFHQIALFRGGSICFLFSKEQGHRSQLSSETVGFRPLCRMSHAHRRCARVVGLQTSGWRWKNRMDVQ